MTRKSVAAGTVTLMSMYCALALAQESPGLPSPEELETVHVLGEQPGPALWKVSKGDNVMWVLGTHGPLPQGVTWRSKQVEERIAVSQQVLFAGGSGIAADIGILHGLTLVLPALSAGKIPDGKRLDDVLPPATYAQWRALREKYFGKDDDVERWRPAIALEMLREKIRAAGRGKGGPQAIGVVRATATKHNVKVHQLRHIIKTVHVEKPRSMIKVARQLDMPDLDCFTRALDTIESRQKSDAAMASAWARGDIRALRELHSGPRETLDRPDYLGCTLVLMDAVAAADSSGGKRAKKLFDSVKWHEEQSQAQIRREWIRAAEAALSSNASTFAVLPIIETIRADGYLAELRDLGYEVEEPL